MKFLLLILRYLSKQFSMKQYWLSSFFIFLSITSYSQENELNFFADAMINTASKLNRDFAQNRFSQLLVEKINTNKSDLTFLDSLRGLSILKLKEYKVRLITWQNKNDDLSFNHFGIIVKENGEIKRLKDSSVKLGEADYEILTPESWYGAYYYEAKFDTLSNHYLLFGFNGKNGDQYEKLIDVLTVNEKGDFVFGKEIFLIKEDTNRPDIKTRINVQYSPSSVIACRHDTDSDMLIHDYTANVTADFDGKNLGKIPDGTYVGYERKGNLWKKIDQLQNTAIQEIKPDYNTKRDNSKPDILGRKRKGN